MYETEVNCKRVEGQPAIGCITALAELKGTVLARTVLPWSEHCTECVWPTCYTTCDLYSARQDGRCRRFTDGMVRIDCDEALNSYILKIRFKRWGKLWTPGNIRLRSVEEASRLEQRDHCIGRHLCQLPGPVGESNSLLRKDIVSKREMAYQAGMDESLPTAFVSNVITLRRRRPALAYDAVGE